MAHDSLAEVMVDYAAQGMTLAQISSRVGMDIEVVHERMTGFLENQATSMSVVQMRMLQLTRLERIIGALWQQVMDGDLLTQGRNVKNLIDTIRELTELMDLKKDPLRDEQIRLTQAQVQLVTGSVEMIGVRMMEKILDLLPENFRETVEQTWNTAFPELAADAVSQNMTATVKMGAGAGPVELEWKPSSTEKD